MSVGIDGKALMSDLPGVLAGASRESNRMDLSRLYGHAAAWLRAGNAPPHEHAQWIAERLDQIQQILFAASKAAKDPADLNAQIARAIGVSRRVRGRPRKSGGRPEAKHYKRQAQ